LSENTQLIVGGCQLAVDRKQKRAEFIMPMKNNFSFFGSGADPLTPVH
jgi:hypothetical protein